MKVRNYKRPFHTTNNLLIHCLYKSYMISAALNHLILNLYDLCPEPSSSRQIQDYIETERLLSIDNVNQESLLSYAREAADFGTNYQLPSLDYAINHYGQPDVAMFDFTSMYASENAALIREKHGHQLLVALVGDSLLEV